MEDLEIRPDEYPEVSYNFIFLVDLGLVLFNIIGFIFGVIMMQTLRWKPRIVLTIGGSIALLGCYASSWARDLDTFILLYCVVGSTGYGICTVPHILCAWEWFPENKGLVNGLITSFYSCIKRIICF